MKFKIIAILFSFLIVFACSSQKDMNQRRNFMIPQKDELPRNSKYKSAKKNNSKAVTKKKKKKAKR